MALSPQQLCWSHRYGRTARSRPCQDFPWAPKPGFSSVGSSKVVQCRGFSKSTSNDKHMFFPITPAARTPENGQLAQSFRIGTNPGHKSPVGQTPPRKIAANRPQGTFPGGFPGGGFHMAFPWLFQHATN